MWGRRHKVMVSAGAPAPRFELTDLAGAKASLDAILSRAGAPCFFQSRLPGLPAHIALSERLAASSKIQIIGISQDDKGSTEAFRQRFGLTFPTLLDQSKEDYPASNAYGISSVPRCFWWNRAATSQRHSTGSRSAIWKAWANARASRSFGRTRMSPNGRPVEGRKIRSGPGPAIIRNDNAFQDHRAIRVRRRHR